MESAVLKMPIDQLLYKCLETRDRNKSWYIDDIGYVVYEADRQFLNAVYKTKIEIKLNIFRYINHGMKEKSPIFFIW